jgi:hypothetical protein
MTDIRKTIDGNTRTHWAGLCDRSPKAAAGISKSGDAEIDEDELYPAGRRPAPPERIVLNADLAC